MTGPNAAFPLPFTAFVDMHNLDRVMRAGEIARFDIGCQVDHYMGDVGRTVPVSGTFTPDQAEVIDLLVATYRAGLAVLRDGVADSTVIQASIAEAARRRGSMRTALGRHAAALIANRDSIPYWQIHGVGLDVAEQLPAGAPCRHGAGLRADLRRGRPGVLYGGHDPDHVHGIRDTHEGAPYSAAEIQRAMRR
jgi:Xaa-Pro aminopeptidase